KGPADTPAGVGAHATTDATTVGTATDLLDRPVLTPQTFPVLPGNSRGGARNAARAERRRKERKRRLIAAGAVAALVLVLVARVLANRSGGGDTAAPPAPGRTQSTVLLEVRQGSSTGLVLLAADPSTGEGA